MMLKISGKIGEKGTKKKLSGAVLKASLKDGQELSTISDSEGAYQLDNIQPGEWTLAALKEKYFLSEIMKSTSTWKIQESSSQSHLSSVLSPGTYATSSNAPLKKLPHDPNRASVGCR